LLNLDEKYIYAACLDKSIKIISRKKAKCICNLLLNSKSITYFNKILLENPNINNLKEQFLLSAGEDGKLFLLNLNKLKKANYSP